MLFRSVHITQGSALVYSVASVSSSGEHCRAAADAARSSACCVGSPVGGNELLPAEASTLPSAATTVEAKGWLPRFFESSASEMAFRNWTRSDSPAETRPSASSDRVVAEAPETAEEAADCAFVISVSVSSLFSFAAVLLMTALCSTATMAQRQMPH